MGLRQHLKNISKRKKRSSGLRKGDAQAGFTLTELLVVIAITGVIVSALMTLVIELISTEQRESTRTETQRSMQLALNYIAADIKQAVYIYDAEPHFNNNASEPSYLNYLPKKFRDEDYRPVVAFWKPRPIDVQNDATNLPNYDDCRAQLATDALKLECENLWKQRRAYSLVVYFQVPNDLNDKKWVGESRLERYELAKYNNLKAASPNNIFDRTRGFVDPAELGGESFRFWPFSGAINCQTTQCSQDRGQAGTPQIGDAGSSLAVLTDFVDNPAPEREDNGRKEPLECKDFGSSGGTYQRIPKFSNNVTAANKGSNSFFICLRDTGNTLGESQDVVVYLRGNAKGRGGANSDSFLPTLQTRITMRGIIDKNVGNSGS